MTESCADIIPTYGFRQTELFCRALSAQIRLAKIALHRFTYNACLSFVSTLAAPHAVLVFPFPPALHTTARLVRRIGAGAIRRAAFPDGNHRRERAGGAAAGGRNSVLSARTARASAAGLGDAALRPFFAASGFDLGTPRYAAFHAQPGVRCAGSAG